MAYNKKQHYRDNITAIHVAFQMDKNGVPPKGTGAYDFCMEALGKYSGFGGLKCVLNDSLDPARWTQYERDLTPLQEELFGVLRENSVDEKGEFDQKQYDAYLGSIRNSVLTAFYTPHEVIDALSETIGESGMHVGSMLDPSAGGGAFLNGFADMNIPETVAIEKDILTGKILKYLESSNATTVINQGFEQLPARYENHFDLVTSNIPFGDFSVFDPKMMNTPERSSAQRAIHNYFFVKALDAAKDGGLVAFITSRWVADSLNNATVRQYLMDNANLVSAMRLPNNLFTEHAGTEVGTDLIVLQKNVGKKGLSTDEKLFLETVKVRIDGNSMGYNPFMNDRAIYTSQAQSTDQYGKPAIVFHYNNDFSELKNELKTWLLADFAKNLDLSKNLVKQETVTPVVSIPTPTIVPAAQVSQALQKSMQLDLFSLFDEPLAQIQQQRQQTPTVPELLENYNFSQVILPHYREGSLVRMPIEGHGMKFGKLDRIDRTSTEENPYGYARFTPILSSNAKKNERVLIRYLGVRDAYEELFQFESEEGIANDGLREQLNRRYDNFVKEFGHIADHKKLIKELDSTWLSALSLEKTINGEIQKADIFFAPVAFGKDWEEIQSAQDALMRSLNQYGYVNTQYIEDNFTKQSLQKTLHELVRNSSIYYDPIISDYVTPDKFISGNVYDKADRVAEAIKTMPVGVEHDYALKGLEDLKSACPEKIAFENIGLQLGERWIPAEFYGDFGKKYIFNSRDEDFCNVKYIAEIDEYVIKRSGYNQHYFISGNSGRSGILADDLLKHALEGTEPQITKTEYINGKAVSVPDFEKQQIATNKLNELRDRFQDYLMSLPTDRKRWLENEYNRRFNGNVRPMFNGEHQIFPGLTLSNLDGIKDLYKAQKDAVWMLRQNGGGVIDHEVGAGKTLTMCVAAYEMKRTGQVNLPLIIGKKNNIATIADTFKKAYPEAKVCYPTEKDFSKENRLNFFNSIKNNRFDVVIMTHDQFKEIPADPDIEQAILKEQLRKLIDGTKALQNGQELSRKQQKGLEMRIENTRNKIQRKQYDIQNNSDDILTANFKTLGFDHIFVDESHEFKNLSFVSRHNRVAGLGQQNGSQKADKLLMAIRSIQDRTGKDLGATFLSGTTIANSLSELYLLFDYLRPGEMKRQGTESFDAWVGMFAKKTKDFEFSVTGEIKSKERFRYFLKVPELAAFYNEITDYKSAEDIGVDRPEKKESLIALKPSEDVKEFSKNLIKFVETKDASYIGREELTQGQKDGIMLMATNLSKKASLDMRIIDGELYGDDPLNKATQASEKIAQYYKKYDAQKGTQFVFADLSTWKSDKEWCVYNDMKQKLVQDYGIPEKEIAFVQQANTQAKKDQMFAAMNRGDIRIIFGSTSMLGTGVNAQERAVAIHHLDIPWRPCDMEQRNGRAVRAKNWVAKEFADNKVDVLVYATEQTLDGYKFNLLQNKQVFIDQLKRGKNGERCIDEGAIDENTGMSFAEYVAVLSGNNDLLEKAKLDRKISVLQSERSAFYQDFAWQKRKIEETGAKVKRCEDYIAAFDKDWSDFEKAIAGMKRDDKGNIIPKINFADGVSTDDPKLIAEKIEQFRKVDTGDRGELKVGNFGGFEIVVATKSMSLTTSEDGLFSKEVENIFTVKGKALLEKGFPVGYTHNHGRMATDEKLCAAYPLNALNKIPTLKDNYVKELASANEKLTMQQKSMSAADGVWKKEAELETLRKKRDKLETRINAELNAKEKGTAVENTESASMAAEPQMEYRRRELQESNERKQDKTPNDSELIIAGIKLDEKHKKLLYSGSSVKLGETQYEGKDCVVFANLAGDNKVKISYRRPIQKQAQTPMLKQQKSKGRRM